MSTETLTLTDFLLARIPEDEAVTRRSLDEPWLVGHRSSCDWWGDMPGYCTCDGTSRVLAECAAKRAIVEAHVSQCENDDPYVWIVASEVLLHALASIYAGHPDFDPAWAE